MQEYIPQLERASTPLVGAQASACDRVCIVRLFVLRCSSGRRAQYARDHLVALCVYCLFSLLSANSDGTIVSWGWVPVR